MSTNYRDRGVEIVADVAHGGALAVEGKLQPIENQASSRVYVRGEVAALSAVTGGVPGIDRIIRELGQLALVEF